MHKRIGLLLAAFLTANFSYAGGPDPLIESTQKQANKTFSESCDDEKCKEARKELKKVQAQLKKIMNTMNKAHPKAAAKKATVATTKPGKHEQLTFKVIGDQRGYFDTSGMLRFSVHKNIEGRDFIGDRAVVYKINAKKYGVIDYYGNLILPYVFDELVIKEDKIAGKYDKPVLWTHRLLYDKQGNEIGSLSYSEAVEYGIEQPSYWGGIR